MVLFQLTEGVAQVVFECVDRLKDTVVKPLLAQLIPEMFDRIEFWRVGREREEPKVCGERERAGLMPDGAIENHDDALVQVAQRYGFRIAEPWLRLEIEIFD